MKSFLIIASFILSICLVQCAAHKTAYNIDASIIGDDRKKLMDTLTRGKALYKQNCSACHGIFAKGKDGVPNFTSMELDRYKAKYLINDRMNHAVIKKLLPADFDAILSFLSHRVPAKFIMQ